MQQGKRLLAVSSPGGHWVQLQTLREACGSCSVVWASAAATSESTASGPTQFRIRDFSKNTPWRVPQLMLQLLWIFVKVRPHVVLSTGAAPGVLAILLGRCFGARTIWVDSVACSERISLSGRIAGPCAHLWLTQWEHLARPAGPHYAGSLL